MLQRWSFALNELALLWHEYWYSVQGATLDTRVFTIVAEDPDAGTNGQIDFILNNFNDVFMINEASLFVAENASIDYEQVTSYSVKLGITTPKWCDMMQ